MKVNVLGHEYEVKLVQENKVQKDMIEKFKNNNGLCENYTNEIYIQKDNYNPSHYKRMDLQREKVGIHELFHAYIFKSGVGQLIDGDSEEAIVDMLAINFDKIVENATKIRKHIQKYERTQQ